MPQIRQGNIYFADLNPVRGHEQAGFRPVLIIQNNILNTNLSTIIIIPITKNLKAKGYLTTYFLDNKKSKLKFDSVALLYQIRTIDKLRLVKFVSRLSLEEVKTIKEQLALVF